MSPALAGGFFTTSATWESRPRGISRQNECPLEMCSHWDSVDDTVLGVHAKPNGPLIAGPCAERKLGLALHRKKVEQLYTHSQTLSCNKKCLEQNPLGIII